MAIAPIPITRTRFLDHDGVRIILLDFQRITDPADGLAAVAEAQRFIARLVPDGTHYTLTDARQARYNREIVEALKGLTTHNRPYVRAAAVVTDSATHRAVITMVAMLTRRKLAVFETREAALEYLAREHRNATQVAAARDTGGAA